ncbi:hypothetical protein ACJMK2_038122, partial [Sinanodonta woodiana]
AIKSESVWVKDVTTSLETDKRQLSDTDLPDDLTFRLIGGSRSLTLNLKRNHAIDPNADVYFVRKLNDGRSYMEKALILQEEDLAYYQDKLNGAFMTVKCLRRSNGRCVRVINGNIQTEERNYDLHPANSDIISRGVLSDVSDLGTRYVLRPQKNDHGDISITHKDRTTYKVEPVMKGLLRHFQKGQEHFPFSKFPFAIRQESGNGRQVYYVEMAVVLDSTIWDFHSSLTEQTETIPLASSVVTRRIREAYSHVINGVNLRYSTIEDPAIKISVTLHRFIIFKTMSDFGHNESILELEGGKYKVEVGNYLSHQSRWTNDNVKISDHVMLFTNMRSGKLKLVAKNIYYIYTDIPCHSYVGTVCDPYYKTSVVQSRDYFLTVTTAAHELAHNLGANHDGEGNAIACMASDNFMMTPLDPEINQTQPYSRNPWVFSTCSVEVFKESLKSKACLNNVGSTYSLLEWNQFTKKLPGQVYSLDKQCELFNGHGSFFCGNKTSEICHFMKCTDPFKTGCPTKDFSAYRGTDCGTNM